MTIHLNSTLLDHRTIHLYVQYSRRRSTEIRRIASNIREGLYKPLSQLTNPLSKPLSQSTQLSKRRNYNRQMRRTLRRYQATTRPPSSRTRLSSPQSHVICSPRFHGKSPLSRRRTTLQFGLLSLHA